ncbi:MAG: protein arginine kinase [Planctomycetota bacterium]|nr:protein arginine kinase [Planctomycetota bacterium]
MHLNDLTDRGGEWLRGTGPESDIVISSRIRIARNLSDFPFIRKASDADKSTIEATIHQAIDAVHQWKDEVAYVNVNELADLDRQFLVERQLISRELAECNGARAVAIDHAEKFSLMINEEDHLRIQVMQSGLDLLEAWKRIDSIDNCIESHVQYAFHKSLGYLTACPTNVGTGLRVSVMLHLPALVMTRELEKVFRSLQKINLAVRGLYGEGSEAMGDFYQISNQITLGKSELELVEQVNSVIPVMIQYEQKARDFLASESRQALKDRVNRAYGILSTAQTISSEETMHLLSSVRMGVNMGLIDLDIPTLNRLFIHTQPAHLQKMHGEILDIADRNIQRASYLQKELGSSQN